MSKLTIPADVNILPTAFVERIKEQFPEEHTALLASLTEESRTSVHLNKNKHSDRFQQDAYVPWFGQGRMLDQRPVFTLDPLFHAGCYYPQESSSMFLYEALTQLFGENKKLKILDLCAAPGGKSILLSSFIGDQGILVSNEIIKSRNAILRENLTKWGSTNVLVTNSDPAKFSSLHEMFDCIVVDAPCSGEGMFRKDHEARNEWSPSNVELCAARQQRIVHDVLPALKEDGVLIYCTCTFAPLENELNCRRWMDEASLECVEFAVPADWNIRVLNEDGWFACQFLPHRVSGEGFFLCAMRKKVHSSTSSRQKPVAVFSQASKKEIEQLPSWLHLQDRHVILAQDGVLYVSPMTAAELNTLCSSLFFTMPGVELGRWLKNDLVPAHAIALSGLIDMTSLNIELDADQALKYLRGEAISLVGEPGWRVVSYEGEALGWVKVLSGRINNYYPKEWRIRMR